jgi:predicted NUDIX family phosphoesterase
VLNEEPEKSHLQERAEKALKRFVNLKPIVLEFAGSPKAGKTSTISQVQTFLKRCGFRVEVIVERASICPIRDKKHFHFNIWTACTTLAQVLEKTQDPPREEDPQILILDRGLFDSIVWLTMMDRLSRITTQDRESVERFLLVNEWRKRISAVILMTASPKDSMERERGYLPVKATGSIMNLDVLEQFSRITKESKQRMEKQFRIHEVDTSSAETNGKPKRTCEIVADMLINIIEEQLKEEVLCLDKVSVASHFKKGAAIQSEDARKLQKDFLDAGRFEARDLVEPDQEKVQALPVAIVRNKTGEVLRLRRKESSSDNKLHEKVVIWAGGHVRREDASNGDPIKQSLLRELQEELRLNIEPNELHLIGAVYSDTGGTTSKHVALVFEWRAETDDVAITLSTAEFFERRGTSLSGKFVSLKELAKDISDRKIDEEWSCEIVRGLLKQKTQTLF